jgi:hypothetical protein
MFTTAVWGAQLPLCCIELKTSHTELSVPVPQTLVQQFTPVGLQTMLLLLDHRNQIRQPYEKQCHFTATWVMTKSEMRSVNLIISKQTK